MSNICLISLIGIPASGKTSFCTDLKRLLEIDNSYKVVHVCFDDFEDFNDLQSGWKSKRREIYDRVEVIVEADKRDVLLRIPTVVILDDNMYYRSMRYEYVKLAKSHTSGYCQLYFESDLESALKLNQERLNPVSEDVVKNIFLKLEKPFPDKYPWESRSLNIPSCSKAFDFFLSVKNLIKSSLQNPLRPCEDTIVNPPPESDIHLSDIALRKSVAEKIKQLKVLGLNNDNFKELTFALSLKKQAVFNNLKSGQIILPNIDESEITSDKDKITIYSEFFSSFF